MLIIAIGCGDNSFIFSYKVNNGEINPYSNSDLKSFVLSKSPHLNEKEIDNILVIENDEIIDNYYNFTKG